MTWESIGVLVAIAGLIITILGAALTWAFFVGKLFSSIDKMSAEFHRFAADFKDHMAKEDQTHLAMWTKLDGHTEKIVEHHQRLTFVEKNYSQNE